MTSVNSRKSQELGMMSILKPWPNTGEDKTKTEGTKTSSSAAGEEGREENCLPLEQEERRPRRRIGRDRNALLLGKKRAAKGQDARIVIGEIGEIEKGNGKDLEGGMDEGEVLKRETKTEGVAGEGEDERKKKGLPAAVAADNVHRWFRKHPHCGMIGFSALEVEIFFFLFDAFNKSNNQNVEQTEHSW